MLHIRISFMLNFTQTYISYFKKNLILLFALLLFVFHCRLMYAVYIIIIISDRL